MGDAAVCGGPKFSSESSDLKGFQLIFRAIVRPRGRPFAAASGAPSRTAARSA